jgi:hypothetical protein
MWRIAGVSRNKSARCRGQNPEPETTGGPCRGAMPSIPGPRRSLAPRPPRPLFATMVLVLRKMLFIAILAAALLPVGPLPVRAHPHVFIDAGHFLDA